METCRPLYVTARPPPRLAWLGLGLGLVLELVFGLGLGLGSGSGLGLGLGLAPTEAKADLVHEQTQSAAVVDGVLEAA